MDGRSRERRRSGSRAGEGPSRQRVGQSGRSGWKGGETAEGRQVSAASETVGGNVSPV